MLVGSEDQTQRPIVFTDLSLSVNEVMMNQETMAVEVFSKRLS